MYVFSFLRPFGLKPNMVGVAQSHWRLPIPIDCRVAARCVSEGPWEKPKAPAARGAVCAGQNVSGQLCSVGLGVQLTSYKSLRGLERRVYTQVCGIEQQGIVCLRQWSVAAARIARIALGKISTDSIQ